MDDRRREMFKPLGLLHWQLRRPELLALQGVLSEPLADAVTESSSRTLWLIGSAPTWLADLCRVLPGEPFVCRDWSPEVEPHPQDLLLLLTASPSQAWRDQPFACCLDATQGKRALWQQLCNCALVEESFGA